MFFANSRIYIFFNYLAQLWTIWNESIIGKGKESTKVSVQSVKITFILFKFHRSIDNSNNLSWKGSW